MQIQLEKFKIVCLKCGYDDCYFIGSTFEKNEIPFFCSRCHQSETLKIEPIGQKEP